MTNFIDTTTMSRNETTFEQSGGGNPPLTFLYRQRNSAVVTPQAADLINAEREGGESSDVAHK